MGKYGSILPDNVQAAEHKLRNNILSPATINQQEGQYNDPATILQGNRQTISDDDGSVIQVRGKDYLNSIYPNEIEFYACALELVDSSGKTIEFFSFPVMPSSISEQFQTLSSIKKTMSGVVVNKNQSFVPFNISISGDFGRRFRNVYSVDKVKAVRGTDLARTIVSTVEQSETEDTVFFDSENKTGYGSTKILERIIKKSQRADSYNRSYNLYFYNLAFNSSYNIEIQNCTFSQSRDKNMIWTYNLTFRALCPATNTQTDNQQANSISNLRKVSSLTNEAKQQSSSLDNIVIDDPRNGLSKIEQILYDKTKIVRGLVNKYEKNNPKLLNAIDEVVNKAKSVGISTDGRLFLNTVGSTISGGIQRFSAFRKSIL